MRAQVVSVIQALTPQTEQGGGFRVANNGDGRGARLTSLPGSINDRTFQVRPDGGTADAGLASTSGTGTSGRLWRIEMKVKVLYGPGAGADDVLVWQRMKEDAESICVALEDPANRLTATTGIDHITTEGLTPTIEERDGASGWVLTVPFECLYR